MKKGLYMGICQAAAQIAIYVSFTLTFYCKFIVGITEIIEILS